MYICTHTHTCKQDYCSDFHPHCLRKDYRPLLPHVEAAVCIYRNSEKSVLKAFPIVHVAASGLFRVSVLHCLESFLYI